MNLWLYAIHKSTRFRLVELVALFLLFPAFELSNFGFQLAYAAGQRRLIRVGAVQLGLQPEQHAVQLDHLGRYSRIRLEREHALRNVSGRLDAAVGTSNPVHHDQVPSGEKSTHEG